MKVYWRTNARAEEVHFAELELLHIGAHGLGHVFAELCTFQSSRLVLPTAVPKPEPNSPVRATLQLVAVEVIVPPVRNIPQHYTPTNPE